MVTDSGKIVAREQWDHPHKEGSSLFRFHFSVANIVQSSVIVFHSVSELVWAWPASQRVWGIHSSSVMLQKSCSSNTYLSPFDVLISSGLHE